MFKPIHMLVFAGSFGVATLVHSLFRGAKMERFTNADDGFENTQVKAKLYLPRSPYGFDRMEIEIESLDEANLFIAWDKSYYTFNDQTQGSFIFSKEDKVETHSIRQDIIFPKKVWRKTLIPASQRNVRDVAMPGFGGVPTTQRIYSVASLKEGVHGCYLVLVGEGKEKAPVIMHLKAELHSVESSSLMDKFKKVYKSVTTREVV